MSEIVDKARDDYIEQARERDRLRNADPQRPRTLIQLRKEIGWRGWSEWFGGRPIYGGLMGLLMNEPQSWSTPEEQSDAVAKFRLRPERKMDWSYFGFPTFTLSNDASELLRMTDFPDLEAAKSIFLPFSTCAFRIPSDGGMQEFFCHQGTPQTDGRFSTNKHDISVICVATMEKSHWYSDESSYRKYFHRNHPEQAPPLKPDGAAALCLMAAALICARKDSVSVDGCGAKGRYEKSNKDIPWSQVKTWTIGRDIRIDPGSRSRGPGIGAATGRRLRRRFMVRGFWRRQACGVGYSEHRLLWIMPFWKGPRSAEEALLRSYEVASRP